MWQWQQQQPLAQVRAISDAAVTAAAALPGESAEAFELLATTVSYWDVLGNARKYCTSNNEPRVGIPQDSFSRVQNGSV